MKILERALKNNRMCKALTGLNTTKFKSLVYDFKQLYVEDQHTRKKDRKRKIGGGRKAVLETIEYKLLFILLYVKVYPTFDLLSFIINLERSEVCRWVHRLLPLLEKTLGRKCVLPDRQINSFSEFITRYPEVNDVFVDGTERKVQRPKNSKKQRKLYSGKKKTHTRKNVVANDDKLRILYLSESKSGRRHDKKMAAKMGVHNIPNETAIWADSGFQGLQKEHPSVVIPTKKTKGKTLTQKEKEDNRIVSGIRVLSEHAIAGIKRMNSTTHVYRNKKENVDDKFMLIASGIWNYHLAA